MQFFFFFWYVYRYCRHPRVFTSVACTQAFGVELIPRIFTLDSHTCPLGDTDVVILALVILVVLTCANRHGWSTEWCPAMDSVLLAQKEIRKEVNSETIASLLRSPLGHLPFFTLYFLSTISWLLLFFTTVAHLRIIYLFFLQFYSLHIVLGFIQLISSEDTLHFVPSPSLSPPHVPPFALWSCHMMEGPVCEAFLRSVLCSGTFSLSLSMSACERTHTLKTFSLILRVLNFHHWQCKRGSIAIVINALTSLNLVLMQHRESSVF